MAELWRIHHSSDLSLDLCQAQELCVWIILVSAKLSDHMLPSKLKCDQVVHV